MAYGLKQAGGELAFKGGLLNGQRYIGLFSAEGTELSGNNYARNGIVLADWQADGAEYENANVEAFGPPQTNDWLALDSWGLFTTSTGGTRILDVDMTDTDPPTLGASVSAMAEALGWGFTGSVTSAGSIAALSEGLLSGTRYLTIHNAATPLSTNAGASTTSNAYSTNGNTNGTGTMIAVQAQAAHWTTDLATATNLRARNNRVLSLGRQVADLTKPQSVALRNGNAHTSDILWTSALTATDPDLGDTLQFNVNGIVIPLTITSV